MRVAIGDKDWAELKPVKELTRADRRAVNAVIVIESEQGSGRILSRVSMDDEMVTVIMHRICTDWSFPFPPPAADADSLDRLSLEQDDALRKAIQPWVTAISGANAPVKENEVPTPASAS